MATTPPLQTAVHTPSTPLHGARYDFYQPYLSRRSTRHSTQRNQRATQTPPPLASTSEPQGASKSDHKGVCTRRQAAFAYSPPSSTQTSPQKKVFRARKDSSAAMDDINSSLDNSSLLVSQDAGDTLLLQSTTAIGANMLPTPAKTPRKKQIHSKALASASRVLFPVRPETVEEVMPTPRKRRNRRHVGFSLTSSFEENETSSEGKIHIFTDSKEKLPELDTSEENPFYDIAAQPGPSQEKRKSRGSKKRKGSSTVHGNKEIEEAFNHEKGMVYVFRGKKIFRKFAEETVPDNNPLSLDWNDTELDAEISSPRLRPFTRSSIKPRLLFPTAAQPKERSIATADDEEAITDIEELPPLPNDSEMTDLAPDTEEETLVTPIDPSLTVPTTPPKMGHATRAATKKALLNPSPSDQPPPEELASSERRFMKKVSPFAAWQRTKATTRSGAVNGKKRDGGILEKGEGGKKVKQ